MKKYFFIAAIVFGFLLTACTADNDEITYAKPEQVKQFDSFDAFAKEGDTLDMEGQPTKPIKRD